MKVLYLKAFCDPGRQREALANALAFQPLEQQLQSRPIHLPRAHLAPVANESSALEPLAPDAKPAAIKIQALDLRAATVHENIQRPIERVTTHRMAGERLQTVVRLAHVRGLPVQVHPDLCLRE